MWTMIHDFHDFVWKFMRTLAKKPLGKCIFYPIFFSSIIFVLLCVLKSSVIQLDMHTHIDMLNLIRFEINPKRDWKLVGLDSKLGKWSDPKKNLKKLGQTQSKSKHNCFDPFSIPRHHLSLDPLHIKSNFQIWYNIGLFIIN